MQQVELRDLLGILQKHPAADTLIFTGVNSKNGPEYFFRKLLKTAKIPLECINDQVPRKHQFNLAGRTLTTYSLTAPSGTANRAIGSMPTYKAAKAQDPLYTTLDFRVEQYRKVFFNE